MLFYHLLVLDLPLGFPAFPLFTLAIGHRTTLFDPAPAVALLVIIHFTAFFMDTEHSRYRCRVGMSPARPIFTHFSSLLSLSAPLSA